MLEFVQQLVRLGDHLVPVALERRLEFVQLGANFLVLLAHVGKLVLVFLLRVALALCCAK